MDEKLVFQARLWRFPTVLRLPELITCLDNDCESTRSTNKLRQPALIWQGSCFWSTQLVYFWWMLRPAASSCTEQTELAANQTQKRCRKKRSIFKLKHFVQTPDCKNRQKGNQLNVVEAHIPRKKWWKQIHKVWQENNTSNTPGGVWRH